MLVRPAKIEDLEEIADLARRAVRALSAGFYDPNQTASAMECITAPDFDLLADGTLHVASQGNRIVGCGAWSKSRKLYTGSEAEEDASKWLDPAIDPARIRAFFVEPDFARQGIARRLYETCKSQAQLGGFRRFELMATLPGVPLYKSLGFEELESVQLLLTDGTKLPAVRMATEI